MRESWVTDVVAGYENDHAPAHEYLGENGEWTVVSRHDLLREVRSAATGWRAAGVRPGDRVAMEATDPRLFVPAFLGALWAGVMPVPVPPPPPQGRRAAWHDHVAAMAAAAQARAIALRAGNAAPAGNERTIVLDTVVAAPPDASDPCHPEPDATAYVQFSSGSTGTPRAIPARVAAVRANGMAIMRDGLRGDPSVDRGLSWLPLHHDMGLVGFVLAPLLIGVPVSFVPTRAFVRRPGLWLRAMSERRATISFAPNFAYALSARRTSPEEIAALRLDHVRVLGCGAEPINHAVLQHFLSTFAPAGLQPEALTPCYGLAEATLAVALAPPDHPYRVDRIRAGELSGGRAVPFDPEIAAPVSAEPENYPTPVISEESATIVSCGPPLAGHQIVVRDDVGEAVAERSIGEIWVRGPSIAHAYLGAVSATHHTFRPDGWLRTGDLGYLADGELFVTGRVKDLLILNGRNIDPQRVEWVAETVAGVRAGGVVACTPPGTGSEELVVVAEFPAPETTANT
ncbi:AMP-binding protein, partial [Nocardia brasiliensis]|uniref:AMP-binding protein n=1 Tax=Nocardia brasiliensis TaxID=37326 RepID=UPI00245906DF